MSLADLPITNRDRAVDDMALLRQYVDEDSQDAFSALLDRHASWIHASARRALRTRDLADDATQTVFVILARKAPSISPNVRVSGWLYHTTRFVISDLRKRSMRHRRRHDLIMRAALERRGTDSMRSSRRLDHVRDTISEALARLPEHERQAISLHFFEGLTFRQMGDVLGLSREGAKKRVARAMARLRAGFAVKGAAVAALATIGAAVRAIFAPTAVNAAISAIGQPALSLTKATKVAGAGVKLLINELTANAVRITALRVATAGAVVGTAVLCGTQMPSSNQQSNSNRQIANRSNVATFADARTSRFSGPMSTGGIAGADGIRNADAPQGTLRTIPTVTHAPHGVQGTALSPRTIGPNNATAAAQFEDPFKRPAVYTRSGSDRSEKPSTRVDDFRGASGGGRSSDANDALSSPVRQPLEVPPTIDPKAVEAERIDNGTADAGAKSTRPIDAPSTPVGTTPGGEVNRKVRRGSNESAAATNTPPKSYDNLSIHGSGSGGHKSDRVEIAKAPATPPTPPAPAEPVGGSRPTLGLPPGESQDATSGDAQHDIVKPDSEKPAQDEHHGATTGGGEIDPVTPPGDHETGGPTGESESGGDQSDHQQSGGNPVVGDQSGGAIDGDGGSFQLPPPTTPPLEGGANNYDLLDHDAPPATPISDALPPASFETPAMDLVAMDGAELISPDLRSVDAPPTPAAPLDLGDGGSPPQPSMQVLPEPSAGLVALVAGLVGFARRRRTSK